MLEPGAGPQGSSRSVSNLGGNLTQPSLHIMTRGTYRGKWCNWLQASTIQKLCGCKMVQISNDSNPHQIHGCIDASETWTFQPPNELAMGWDLINPDGLWRCNVLQMKVHNLYSNIKQSGYITTTKYHPKITSKCIPNQVESTVKKD